jgi:hypothetical protein
MQNANNELEDTLHLFHDIFTLKIDFCIWILLLDGLSVFPFTQHPKGNRMLQKLGLNSESWFAWMKRVVNTRDQRLTRTKTNLPPQAYVEEAMALYQVQAKQGKKIDLAAKRVRTEKIVYGYFELEASVYPFGWESPPADVWAGERKIGEALKELWQEYLELVEEEGRGTAQSGRFGLPEELFQQLNRVCQDLFCLHIYQVEYPYPVGCAVPPNAILLSSACGAAGSSNYCKIALGAAESLIQAG